MSFTDKNGREVRATGVNHRRFLADLHKNYSFDWYMEIGCRQGKSFAQVRSKTIAVDPEFSIKTNVIGAKPELHLFQKTSDDFFASRYLEKNEIEISVTFLDGMHLFEFLLRDFIGTERNSSPDGVILLHDCCPWTHEMTTRDLDNLPDGPWTGDVWKMLPILQKYRPDLKIDVLDCKPTGLVAVSNLDPNNTILSDAYDEIEQAYMALDLEIFDPKVLFDSFTYVSADTQRDTDFPLFQSIGRAADDTNISDKKTSTSTEVARAVNMMPKRSFRDWGVQDPKILIATCMKNEGPFILEWVAWHKAIGVTDFVVYTNDCSDGTTEILDRLQELGHITHLENPAVAKGSTYFQPEALNAVHMRPEFLGADFVISIDVDEFINIRSGEGTLSDLFDATGPFDVLSMSELNHGSNAREGFEPGWVTEQFPGHQTEEPGHWKAARGVKSITRLSENVHRIRNHRPDVAPESVWLNGSGKQTSVLRDDPQSNGFDTRDTYKHVVLDHYPLRALDSYLIKMDRGDVVIGGKMVSQRYWRLRNQNDNQTSDMTAGITRARALYHELFESDAPLMELQNKADQAHAARIAEIIDDDLYRERKDWIFENSW